MLIRLAYDIQFEIPAEVAIVALLNVHPSRAQDLLEPDELQIEPKIQVEHYIDSFGNRCARFVAPPGPLRLSSTTLVDDSGDPIRGVGLSADSIDKIVRLILVTAPTRSGIVEALAAELDPTPQAMQVREEMRELARCLAAQGYLVGLVGNGESGIVGDVFPESELAIDGITGHR